MVLEVSHTYMYMATEKCTINTCCIELTVSVDEDAGQKYEKATKKKRNEKKHYRKERMGREKSI